MGDSEQYRFKATSRDSFEYIEGDFRAEIQAEQQGGSPSRIIYRSTLKGWKPPREEERMDGSKREQIIERLVDFLKKTGDTPIVR